MAAHFGRNRPSRPKPTPLQCGACDLSYDNFRYRIPMRFDRCNWD